MYKEFAAKLAELDSLWPDAHAKVAALQAQLDAAMRAAFKREFPRKRYPGWHDASARLGPAGAVIYDPLKAQADAISVAMHAARDAAESELERLAADLPLPIGEGLRPRLYDEVHSSRYGSQGWGACKYARADADRTADKARMHGLAAEVHELERHYIPSRYGGTDSATYGVLIDTTPIGWEVLKRKPAVPLRETVRLCWKRGVNPRVSMPFLPHGYEESVGLDYFGGEVKAA